MGSGYSTAGHGGVSALWGDASPLGGLLACALAYGAGYLIRYRFVEPEALGAACERSHHWWCPTRTGLIVFTQWNGFGYLALGTALVAAIALARGNNIGCRRLAFAAGVIAGFGMILYSTTTSVSAAILALLCLIRARGAAG